jgi:hypothetical protein
MFPGVGTAIGLGTIASNIVKAINDIRQIAWTWIAESYYMYAKGEINRMHREQFELAKEDFLEHVKFIAIGIVRCIPFVGGYVLDMRNNYHLDLIKVHSAKIKDLTEEKVIKTYRKELVRLGDCDSACKLAEYYEEKALRNRASYEINRKAFKLYLYAVNHSAKDDVIKNASQNLARYYSQGLGVTADLDKKATYEKLYARLKSQEFQIFVE